MVQLFNEAGLPTPHVAIEHATHDIHEQDSAVALLMGTGYRSVLAQLSAQERVSLLDGVSKRLRAEHVANVKTDVIYAICQKAGV